MEFTILGLYDGVHALSHLRVREMLRSFGHGHGWAVYSGEPIDTTAYTSIIIDSAFDFEWIDEIARRGRDQRRVVILDIAEVDAARIVHDHRFSTLLDSLDAITVETVATQVLVAPFMPMNTVMHVPTLIDPQRWSLHTEESRDIVMIDSKAHYELASTLPSYLQSDVVLLDPRDVFSVSAFARQIAGADIGICTDGLPLGPLLFGAARVPVIASMSHLTTIGRRGIVLSDADVLNIASAVDRLREDRSLHYRLASSLHDHVCQRWSIHNAGSVGATLANLDYVHRRVRRKLYTISAA
jgi:hypothetical protein